MTTSGRARALARAGLSAFPIGIAYDGARKTRRPTAHFLASAVFSPVYLKFLSQIAQQTIFVFLLIGAVFALAAGLVLIFRSELAFRAGERMNRWVSTRAAMRSLEEHHSIARPLYRMHRLVGILICAGALYSLFVLGTPYGEMALTRTLSGIGPKPLASFASESLRILLLGGNVGALLFGLVFAVRPSALKGLEAWADRRISGRKVSKPLEQVRLSTDEFVRSHPRLVGVFVTAGSLYVLATLGFALLFGR
jgi:hypothetical protein